MTAPAAATATGTPPAPPPAAATGTAPSPAAETKPAATETKPAVDENALLDASKAQPEATKPAATAIELKLPEGYQADEKALGNFKTLAAKVGLDSAKAQEVFDGYVAFESEREKAFEVQFKAHNAKGLAAIKADPDIGGEKYSVSQREAAKAIAKLGGQKLVEKLHAAGLSNDIDVFRGFVAIGRALKDDSIAGGGTTPAPANGTKLPDHVLLYGKK